MRMTRLENNSKKDFIKQVQSEMKTDEDEQKKNALAISKSATGSFSNMPMESPYFRKWLADRQASNPLIGKHVAPAPEYNTPTKNFGEEVLDSEDPQAMEMLNLLTSDKKDFDKSGEEVFGVEVPDDAEAIKFTGSRNFDKKFVDIVIVENVTRSLPPSATVDEVREASIREMREFHEDDNYSVELNYSEIVENTRVLMIANDKEKDVKIGLIARFAKDHKS